MTISVAQTELKNIMVTKKITQTELGQSVGVSQALVGQWVRGERPISVQKAVELEQIFDVDAALLNDDVKLARESMTRKTSQAKNENTGKK